MRKTIVILFLIYMSFVSCAFAMEVSESKKDSPKEYIDSVCAIADSLYSANNMMPCFSHLKQVIDFYCIYKEELIMNDEICRTIFETYTSYIMSENPISLEERIENLSQALNIIELNSNWIKLYPHKQDIINVYIKYIGYLIEAMRIDDAQKANQSMLDFAEAHYKLGLADVIMSACGINALMGRFELNHHLYQRLYDKFDELDKLQQYDVLTTLIHFEFKDNNYSEVINLATKHLKLIQWRNDKAKDSILFFISLSFERNAFVLENAVSMTQYSEKVNDAYLKGYNWSKANNSAFLPRSIRSWAYYKYKWDATENDAILLFYELLDFLQNKNIEEPLFDKYCEIEDAQQAIISIILTQILNTSSPIDLNNLIAKYNRVFFEIIQSKRGEYYNDLIRTIEVAHLVCYGE